MTEKIIGRKCRNNVSVSMYIESLKFNTVFKNSITVVELYYSNICKHYMYSTGFTLYYSLKSTKGLTPWC